MPEVAAAGEGHRRASLRDGCDHVLVAARATRLDDRRRARVEGDLRAVGEGEEGVGGEGRSCGVVSELGRLLDRDPHRVDSVRLAIDKARATGSELEGAALASDAFFPFPDGPQIAVEAGIMSIIKPGGSKRDFDVVEVADDAGISMVFTHRRHFKH